MLTSATTSQPPQQQETMATSSAAAASSAAVKCLNTSSFSRKRFVFKSFSQRVQEIDIDVFRSLEAVKAEPSGASSFFLEELVKWRELNTAVDFISFYEEIIPLAQTLAQIILQREKIFFGLIQRVNMKARLSLEPILMLIAALSRDILEEFLPFLGRLANAIVALLKDGGDRDAEILEQVFTSWSYIMMHLQRYLVKDVIHILMITASLRSFPKEYVREFMAESVSFLLRNAPLNQLTQGLQEVLDEVAGSSSSMRIEGVIALLWHTMRGTSTRLHSRAKKVLRILVDKSTLTNVRDKFPEGFGAVLEVITGVIHRICNEVDSKELATMYTCLFGEIENSIKAGCLEHLKHLLGFLACTLQNSKEDKALDKVNMIKLLELLVSEYFLPVGSVRDEVVSSGVLRSILDLMLCLLDVPLISADLTCIVPFYTPLFQMRNSRATDYMINFIKQLLSKGPQTLNAFGDEIMSAMNNSVDTSPEEVLFIMVNFFRRPRQQLKICLDKAKNLCNFLKSRLYYWTELSNDMAAVNNCSDKQISEMDAALLWAAIFCYPQVAHLSLGDVSPLKNLIGNLDRLLEMEAEHIRGLSKSTWRSMLGAALSSYREILLVTNQGNSEVGLFLSLAKRHNDSLHVLSAVADFLDSDPRQRCLTGDYSEGIVEEFSAQNSVDAFLVFSSNLSSPNKDVRIWTLKILSYYAKMDHYLASNDERPHKIQKTEDSGLGKVHTEYNNVVDILLAIEATPISIDTSRKIAILVSRLRMSLSSETIHDEYVPLLLHGIIGIFYNRFSDLWPPALDCLAVLIVKHKELVWSQFIQFLADYQSKATTSKDRMVKDAESEPDTILYSFNLYLAPDFDCTPCETIGILLLQSLQKIPDVAESRSRQLIPLFLNFMGYSDENINSVDLYVSDKCKGKQWKSTLKEWLNLLRLMRNARSLYRSRILQEVLTKRVLDESDPDIQTKALDCLLNWKDDFLTPYNQNLKNLIDSKTLREELTTWAVSRESAAIQEEHRSCIVPLVMRLLAPKVRKLKLLGSRKRTGVNHRKAILRFLLQFDSNELQLFFSLLLKSLLPMNLHLEILGCESDNLLGNISDVVMAPNTISIDKLPWKKTNGFLRVVEDIFGTFDMKHMEPFLNLLLMIIVQILQSCMQNLQKLECRVQNLGGEINKNVPCADSHSADYNSVNLKGDDSSTNTGVCQKEKLVPEYRETSASIKQLKDLRALCIRLISLALRQYEGQDFGDHFWNIFFMSVKPLIDSFKQEASSSEKPSSLFSCFMAMSRSPMLVSLLGTYNLVKTIFSILSVRTASEAIISSVLEFVENLLRLDSDLEQQEDHSVKKLLLPHMDFLLDSLHDLVNFRRERCRKSGMCLGQRELRLFGLLLNYIKHQPAAAERVVELLLPFFNKKDMSSDECLEALHVVRGVVPALSCEASGKIVIAISPLLVTVGLELRLCICDILDGLASHESSLICLARLLRDLNAVSASELGEIDYDTRVRAYQTVQPHVFSEMGVEHAVAILSHCVYDMSSEELIFRSSASTALQHFLEFAASVLNRESNCSLGTIVWTKCSVLQILEKIYLHNIAEAMGKDISIHKEWVMLLREMVYNFEHVPYLSSFRPLCSEEHEKDFCHNIIHLQASRRSKALSLFKQKICDANFSEDVMMKVFVPLFFSMLFDVKAGKGEQIRDLCIGTLASVAAKVQWGPYRSILMRCFREMRLKPDKQKILLRLICTILDSFHFKGNANDVPKSSDARNENKDASVTFSSLPIVSSEKQHYLQKSVYPHVQKLLAADPEKVNVNINLVALKLLKLLPVDYFESQLSSIIHRVCNFLKSRLESVRDEARSVLAASLKELGLEYLQFIVKILRAILRRGYELHILGYTLHYLLSKTEPPARNGKLDYCLEDLLAVVEADILGDTAEEKEVEKIASKMKETKKRMSFETLKFVAQCITFRTHAFKLISPMCKYLQRHLTPKTKKRLEMMLHNIALGIECNPSSETTELFIFIYGLIEETIVEGRSNSSETSNTTPSQKNNLKGTFLVLGMSRSQNSHLLTKFALGLLHCRLKSIKRHKKSEELLSMLDPFIKLFGECLKSKYENVLSAAFRCLTLLIKLPLPSLKDHANPIKNFLLEIAQRAGNSTSPLTGSCLKLLADLLRVSRISLSDDQLRMLVCSPIFVDLQTNPSPIALSLLMAIVQRKLVCHEVYDIMVRIGELMVTTLNDSIRRQCIQILLHFFQHYQLSKKRLQQHMDFLLVNLSYEHSSGREAVVEMLHAVLTKFPEREINSQGQTFFLHLVLALANEHHREVSSMIHRTIQKLLECISKQGKNYILEYTLQWYIGKKQQMWSAAAQVIRILVEVLKSSLHEHLEIILAVARQIMRSSLLTSGGIESELSKETGPPFWKEAYHSMVMIEGLLKHFPELYVEQNMEEMWMLVCKFLIHPHYLLRNVSSGLIAEYFTSVENRTDELDIRSFLLVRPSSLFLMAASFLKQLRTELSDSTANDQISKNLAYSVCKLHITGKRTTSLHQFWSDLCSREQGSFLEGFELLGSSKAKNTFLICTSSASADGSEDLPSLLVPPLLKRMGKVAVEMGDEQMKIVFECFKEISSRLDAEESIPYAHHFLVPLYKVCEGFAGKIISDEVKHLAEEVRDSIRNLIGVERFVEVYNNVRKGLKRKRESRKQAQKVIAVVNPTRHAKRKLRIAAKHRAHKRRKMMAMKMGRWM